MSRIRINRKKAQLNALLGIRARLVLFALILVGPLMVERIRSLHQIRTSRVAPERWDERRGGEECGSRLTPVH